MKRRNFLASLSAALSAPFVPKVAAGLPAPTMRVDALPAAWSGPVGAKYIVAVDWARDAIELPDRHSVVLMSHRKGITP